MTSADELVRGWPRAFGFENVDLEGADGVRLRLVVGGPPDGPPVVLLHGAPQISYAFRRVMTLLQDRYRVIAPDLRGYGASEIPAGGRYDLETLASDLGAVVAWAEARHRDAGGAGDGRPIAVGHDWGGPIAWTFAARHPERLRHLVAVNGPHPAAFAELMTRPAQMRRSWYIALCQVPLVDVVVERTQASLLLWMLKASSPPGTFGEVDLDLYQAALNRPGRVRAAIAYYRQAFSRDLLAERRRLLRSPPVSTPATVVWGDADAALVPAQAEATRRYATRVEVRRLPAVSHWVPEEQPEAVAQAVRDAGAGAGGFRE